MTAPQAERPLILPPLRRTAKDAEAFARIVHEGQTDKAGRPYVEHLERVVGRLEWKLPQYYSLSDSSAFTKMDEALQIAWLHDVLEPDKRPYGPVLSDDLLREGFALRVVARVEILCREFRGQPYRAKIDWVVGQAANLGEPSLILLKIADVEDNSDPERLALLDEPTRERLKKKYGAALPILKHAAARMGWRQGNG